MGRIPPDDTAYRAMILKEPALVSYYPCQERFGTSIADHKGANTGTLTGGVRLGVEVFEPLHMYMADFDGAGGRISLGDPASLRFSTAYTFEAIVNFDILNTEGDMFNRTNSYQLDMENFGKLSTYRRTAATGFAGAVSAANTLGYAVTHVAGTYDSANLRAYLNSVQVASAAATGTIDTNVSGVALGAATNGAQATNFRACHFAFYNAALTQADIQRHVRALFG